MARPRIPQSRHRSNRIVYRLTDAELLQLAHKAAVLNLRLNECARQLALRSLKKNSVHDSTDSESVKYDPALIQQIHHIGHNLNQLVKNAHIFGRISPQVDGLCARIEQLVDEALYGSSKEGH